MASFLSPILKNPSVPRRLVNERSGTIVATRLLTAFDSTSRRTGLLHHASMPDGTALIIAPCNAVHTIGMQFDIDIAFASKEGRLVKIRRAVKPWRLSGSLRAFAVIELAAGALECSQTLTGDILVVV